MITTGASFDNVDEEYISPRCSTLDDWDNTIDTIMTKLDHPNLKLRIYFADFYTASHASSLRKNITREEGITKVVTAYIRIVRPLGRLKDHGLSQLFVHAAWPWSWTRAGRNTLVWKEHVVKNDVSRIERRLEKRVMGEDYDSVRLQKRELEKSQWLKSHERSEEYASVID